MGAAEVIAVAVINLAMLAMIGRVAWVEVRTEAPNTSRAHPYTMLFVVTSVVLAVGAVVGAVVD